MRKIFWPLFAILMWAGTSCQKPVNVEKEKEAILALLHEEADAIKAGDLERLYATHLLDSMETRMELGIYGYNSFQGGEEVKKLLDDAIPGLMEHHAENLKENVVIKVSGNAAWVTCDNTWRWTFDGQPGGYHNIQITFLEKVGGKWKISFAAYYNKSMPTEEETGVMVE